MECVLNSPTVPHVRPADTAVHPTSAKCTILACRDVALAIFRARKERGMFFDRTMFSDPAWDILLELFVAHAENRRIQVSALGLDSSIPLTTTIRWLAALSERGLIKRSNDPLDGRRCFIALSDAGERSMISYLQAFQQYAITNTTLPIKDTRGTLREAA